MAQTKLSLQPTTSYHTQRNFLATGLRNQAGGNLYKTRGGFLTTAERVDSTFYMKDYHMVVVHFLNEKSYTVFY